MATLPELLKMTVELGGSDLHLATNTPPQVRIHGRLQRLDLPELTPTETKQLAYSVMTDAQKKAIDEFKAARSVDISGPFIPLVKPPSSGASSRSTSVSIARITTRSRRFPTGRRRHSMRIAAIAHAEEPDRYMAVVAEQTKGADVREIEVML